MRAILFQVLLMIRPNSVEICGNGIDENCNGVLDDVCTGTLCANNVIENSGFENGLSGFNTTNVSTTQNQVHTGLNAVKICGNQGYGSQSKPASVSQIWIHLG
jgi:hypothetical protein